MSGLGDAGGPVRTGAMIVGAGLMGRWHAAALRRAGVPVRVVVDEDLDAARRLARRVGAEAFGDLEAALDGASSGGGSAGSVHVCTPEARHFDVASAALDAGMHVLVEKPMTADVTGAETLYRRAAEAGRLLCPVHQCLFQPGVARMAGRLDDLGRLRHLEGMVCSAGAEGMAAAERDRVAVEILPHALSLAERFLALSGGASLDGVRWRVVHPAPGEIQVCGGLSVGGPDDVGGAEPGDEGVRARTSGPVPDGATLLVRVSMAGRPRVNRFRVVGETATGHMDLFHGFSRLERVPATRAGKLAHPFVVAAGEARAALANLGSRVLRRQRAYPGLWELVRAFHEAVRSGGGPPIAAREALAVARARDRIMAATRIGAP